MGRSSINQSVDPLELTVGRIANFNPYTKRSHFLMLTFSPNVLYHIGEYNPYTLRLAG